MRFFGQMTWKKPNTPYSTARIASIAVLLFGTCSAAQAYAAAPPPPPAAPPAMGPGYNSGPGSPGMPRVPGGAPQGPTLQLGPAGRWWDNNSFAKTIGLKHEQQMRMDTVFNANKAALFSTYRTLKSEESKLDTLQRAETPDEDKILAQIDKVTELRGQLTKASASLVLQLRKELTPEQIKQLETAQ